MTEFSEARAKRILLISLVVVGMGFTVLFPILAPVGREMGLTEFQITAIIGASSITVFLASPRWGRLSDRLGRKAVILIGLFGFAFGTFLFNGVIYLGLSAAITGTTLFAALVASRMVHAAVMSATMPAANAFMADITSAANRTKGMGAAGAANNLGSMLGPAVAALAVFSLLMPLWVMAALAFLNGLFLWRFLPEPPRHNAPRLGAKMRYRDPRIFPFIIVGVTMFSGMALVQQTMGFRFQDALNLSATETAQAVGLSGGGRLHDLFVNFEGITPRQYKDMGDGLDMRYGVHRGFLGEFVVAATDRGICGLQFFGAEGPAGVLDDMRKRFPGAAFREAQAETWDLCASVFRPGRGDPNRPLRLWYKGTNFQIKVWQAMLSIPPGELVTYGDIARAIG